MLDIFIQDTPVALGRLRAAIDDGDMRSVVKLTHTLKAACSLFGVPDLVARLEAAESAARRSEPGAAALAAAAIPGVECLVDAVRRDRQADEEKAR